MTIAIARQAVPVSAGSAVPVQWTPRVNVEAERAVYQVIVPVQRTQIAPMTIAMAVAVRVRSPAIHVRRAMEIVVRSRA